MKPVFKKIYQRLYASLGPQGWWPAETPFEVIIGAILTQNTNWQNVAKAISNLKEAKAITARTLYSLPRKRLTRLIRPAGYYNIKTERLECFLKFLFTRYRGSVRKMRTQGLNTLRLQLLSVKGIGPETADSILLYALGKPVFVVDAYTRRIFTRHSLIKGDEDYHAIQNLIMKNLKRNVQLFNEFHALLVEVGKKFCRKKNPRCARCPLQQFK
ncbi:MAG: endonuclease III domain-containing protein [Candidatus Omnitrophota bacterium]|jgi:endonuclease-3 related protein|nr:MAG: endonuclease III domain-containing protein [Candidatus Omnitrophota bacterium]